MKAIIFTHFGTPDVLQLAEVPQPVLEDERVLVKVRAVSINALDGHAIRNGPLLLHLISGNGLRTPKDQRMGVDLAGEVVAVGAKVTQFKPGDVVFGRGPGAMAEYSCARESSLALKPANLSFAAAAAVPVAALTALEGLRDVGKIQPGQKVVIQGAGGGVGTFAVQLAKYFGAEVTAVCGPQHQNALRELGADHLIDYTQSDFTKTGQRYDLIVAVNGYHPLRAYRRALRPRGRVVMIGASINHMVSSLYQFIVVGSVMARVTGKTTGFLMVKARQEDLLFLKDLLEVGKLTPLIDRQYPLSQATEAFRYVEAGHIGGKVVLMVDDADQSA